MLGRHRRRSVVDRNRTLECISKKLEERKHTITDRWTLFITWLLHGSLYILAFFVLRATLLFLNTVVRMRREQRQVNFFCCHIISMLATAICVRLFLCKHAATRMCVAFRVDIDTESAFEVLITLGEIFEEEKIVIIIFRRFLKTRLVLDVVILACWYLKRILFSKVCFRSFYTP